MIIRDASGAIVPTDRCGCGRHKETVKEKCCAACGTGRHAIGCVLRAESFADTKRGVSVSSTDELRVKLLKPSRQRDQRKQRGIWAP